MKLGKFDFTDKSYDGAFDNKTGLLSNGLGDLVDEYLGSNDLQTGWVGFNLSKVVLLFEFSKELSFDSVTFRLRALARSDKLLERIEVKASSDGREFTQVRMISNVMKESEGDDLVVSINVHSAKFIKCILSTNEDKDVLLISEVSFSKGM